MKVIWYFTILILIASSCKHDNVVPDKNSTEETPKPIIEQIDLSHGGLPLAIVSEDLKTSDIDVKWNAAFGRMELSKNNTLDIFITQDTLSCMAKKIEVESGIFDVTYIENTDSLIFYKTTLPDGSTPYWHFFASFDVDGVHYNFENDPLIECTEKQVEQMTHMVSNIRKVTNSTKIRSALVLNKRKFASLD